MLTKQPSQAEFEECWSEAIIKNGLTPSLVDACEHCWTIEGWIHSKRRNKIHQKFVEKLVRSHTNLVLRESLDVALHHLLPWDIELIIDEPVDESEEEPEV
jgi:hypothetical protein